MKKLKLDYGLLILWLLIWIYKYFNPIWGWVLILLFAITIYFWIVLIIKVFQKRIKEKFTLILFFFVFFTSFFSNFIDQNTFRSKCVKRYCVDRFDSGQYRILELREGNRFNDYSEDWLHLKALGINFRESYGFGSYKIYNDSLVKLHYQTFNTTRGDGPLKGPDHVDSQGFRSWAKISCDDDEYYYSFFDFFF